MFRTHPIYLIDMPLPPELFGQESGLQHWRAFDVVIHGFWFVVEYLIEDVDGGGYWQTICVDDIQSTITLVSTPDVLKHRINLVIPTFHNAERQLQMKPLVEVYTAEEDGQASMTIYVTSDGTRYVDSALHFGESNAESYAENRAALYVNHDINIRADES